MGKQTFVLKKPLLGWATGEKLIYDPEWNEWTRKKTGESYDLRGSIGQGEIVLLLNCAAHNKYTSILEPTPTTKFIGKCKVCDIPVTSQNELLNHVFLRH